jgi:HSP20 family protein
MTLIKRNPNRLFPAFPSLFDDILTRDFFNTPWEGASVPAVNIKEDEKSFELELAAPGLKREDLKIEIDHNVLSISSTAENKREETDEKGGYTRREFHYQSFRRAFTLPDTVASDKIEAKYDQGILRVTLPKRDEAQARPSRMIEIG